MSTETTTLESSSSFPFHWDIPPTQNELNVFNEISSKEIAGVKYFHLMGAKTVPVNGYLYTFVCAAETIVPHSLESIYLAEIQVWEFMGRPHISSIKKLGPVPADAPGGWGNWRFPASYSAVAALHHALPHLYGATYTPLASTSQLVNGINYCLLCEQTLVLEHPVKTLCLVYLHQSLNGHTHLQSIKSLM